MRRVEGEYVGRIGGYEEEVRGLRTKLKKQELVIAKMEERTRELEEEQLEKVIITRAQLGSYKHTEKRL